MADIEPSSSMTLAEAEAFRAGVEWMRVRAENAAYDYDDDTDYARSGIAARIRAIPLPAIPRTRIGILGE